MIDEKPIPAGIISEHENMPIGFNFAHETISQADVDAIIQPVSGEKVIRFTDDWDMPQIAVETGLFASKSQARKNGWEGQIPQGFWQRWHKKDPRKSVFLLNKA